MVVACNLADALHYLQFLHLGNSLDDEALESLEKAKELIKKSHNTACFPIMFAVLYN